MSCQMWRSLKVSLSLSLPLQVKPDKYASRARLLQRFSDPSPLATPPTAPPLHHLARQPFAILRDISACRAFRLHLSNATPVHPGHRSRWAGRLHLPGPKCGSSLGTDIRQTQWHVPAAFFFGLSPAAAFVDCRFFVLRHCKRRTRCVKQNQRQQGGQPEQE